MAVNRLALMQVRQLHNVRKKGALLVMERSKLEKLITNFVVEHNLDAQFVQQTEGLTYVRFVVEEDEDDD